METQRSRTITIPWIASSSIRTIGAIVNICKRLNGNHYRMPGTIEAIKMYSKMHWLFQDSMRSKKCVPKWHNKEERVETKILHQCMVHEAAKFPHKSILHYAYSLIKENNSAIPLGL